jgi:hypothetical protein
MSITSDIKNQPCAVCGGTPADAADGDGRRLCAVDAAFALRSGAPSMSWDGDAPQLHWHSAHTVRLGDGTLAVIVGPGPCPDEAGSRRALTEAVAAWQGDLKIVTRSGHELTIAEAWALLPAAAVFTLPGEDSRTFSTYPCAGDCDTAQADHLTTLSGRIEGERLGGRQTA